MKRWALRISAVLSLLTLLAVGAWWVWQTYYSGHQLWESALANDITRTRKLLRWRADPRKTHPGGITLLHYATFNGNPEMVRLLIDAGCNVNAKLDAKLGDEHLLAGSDGLIDGGETPLHVTVKGITDIPEIADALIKAGADITSVDSFGGWPFSWASTNLSVNYYPGNRTKTSQLLLLKAVPDVNLRDIFGRTPLHYSVTCSKRLTQRLILDKANVNAIDKEGATPLFLASYVGKSGIIQLLLKAGANPNIKAGDVAGLPEQGCSPLHVAARYGRTDAVKLLLANGANVNTQNMRNQTPLHSALMLELHSLSGPDIHGGDPSQVYPIVKELLRAGSTIQQKDNNGQTPLTLAERKTLDRKDEIVNLLKGAK